MHKPRFALIRKSFQGMESEPMLTSREKFPLPEKNSPQRSIEPTTLHQAGQRVQHTTNEPLPLPSFVQLPSLSLSLSLSLSGPSHHHDGQVERRPSGERKTGVRSPSFRAGLICDCAARLCGISSNLQLRRRSLIQFITASVITYPVYNCAGDHSSSLQQRQ